MSPVPASLAAIHESNFLISAFHVKRAHKSGGGVAPKRKKPRSGFPGGALDRCCHLLASGVHGFLRLQVGFRLGPIRFRFALADFGGLPDPGLDAGFVA